MTIWDRGVVDMVVATDDGRIRLIMVDASPPDFQEDYLEDYVEAISEKITEYIMFYHSEEFKKKFPDAAGSEVGIEMIVSYPVHEGVREGLYESRKELAKYGLSFILTHYQRPTLKDDMAGRMARGVRERLGRFFGRKVQDEADSAPDQQPGE